jgi:hypothetical protein
MRENLKPWEADPEPDEDLSERMDESQVKEGLGFLEQGSEEYEEFEENDFEVLRFLEQDSEDTWSSDGE